MLQALHWLPKATANTTGSVRLHACLPSGPRWRTAPPVSSRCGPLSEEAGEALWSARRHRGAGRPRHAPQQSTLDDGAFDHWTRPGEPAAACQHSVSSSAASSLRANQGGAAPTERAGCPLHHRPHRTAAAWVAARPCIFSIGLLTLHCSPTRKACPSSVRCVLRSTRTHLGPAHTH